MTLESLKIRIDNVDEDIKEIKQSIADHKRDTQMNINTLTNTINMVKDNQADQKLINQKMDFTLDSINIDREREKESKKERDSEMKKLKLSIFSLIGTLVTSLIVATVRFIFGM